MNKHIEIIRQELALLEHEELGSKPIRSENATPVSLRLIAKKMNSPIEELGLEEKTLYAIKNNFTHQLRNGEHKQIVTVGDLALMSEQEVFRNRGFGMKKMQDLENKLLKFGLCLTNQKV